MYKTFFFKIAINTKVFKMFYFLCLEMKQTFIYVFNPRHLMILVAFFQLRNNQFTKEIILVCFREVDHRSNLDLNN